MANLLALGANVTTLTAHVKTIGDNVKTLMESNKALIVSNQDTKKKMVSVENVLKELIEEKRENVSLRKSVDELAAVISMIYILPNEICFVFVMFRLVLDPKLQFKR